MITTQTKTTLLALSERPGVREARKKEVFALFDAINQFLEGVNSHFRIETWDSSNDPSKYMRLIVKERRESPRGTIWVKRYEDDRAILKLDDISTIELRVVGSLTSLI